MQKKANHLLGISVLIFLLSGLIAMQTTYAGAPIWTFEPLTATTLAVPENSTAIVQYRVTNQSPKLHNLVLQPIKGVTQISGGVGTCGNPFTLRAHEFCVLSLQVNGGLLTPSIRNAPVVCQQGSNMQCYSPSAANALKITQAPAINDALIYVTDSPLTLTVNGPSAQLTIINLSTLLDATNITSNFTGTALDGNVIETGNTCTSVPPGGSCTLTYTPGNTVIPLTNFTIQGTNTDAVTAAIAIESGSTLTNVNPASGTTSGGTGVTLTGVALTGATGITFGGIPATSVNVVSSTMVTAVTPVHNAGLVDVTIDTPAGGATLVNGYAYVAPAIGQNAEGGSIACLNGGLLNLIAATTDNSNSIIWGPIGLITNGQSQIDGAANTTTIVNVLGAGTYAAQLCTDYEVDSQGNSPCQVGNTCYTDWFLPAQDQLSCFYDNRNEIGGFSITPPTSFYWSSTEVPSSFSADFARMIFFDAGGSIFGATKSGTASVRCAHAFTP